MDRSLEERFWEKVDVRGPDECWPWLAGKVPGGYGAFFIAGKMLRSHRVAYELAIGPIPEGMVIDHVKARGCNGTDCTNPAHLEPVTVRENNLRGESPAAQNARKTHCARGHDLRGARRTSKGWRYCRVCDRLRKRRERAAVRTA